MRFRSITVLLTLAVLATAARGSNARLDEALVLYEDGRFAEARLILEELDGASSLDGSWLYRLAFCQRTTGAGNAAAETEQRAIPLLESALARGAGLETSFYLTSAYRNAGRNDDADRVARDVASAASAGDPQTRSRIDRFRVGKLHADLRETDQARTWLESALDGALAGELPDAYVQWAERYLARLASLADDDVTAPALERLAVEAAREGDFAASAAAWKRAISLGSSDPNRTQYALRLVEQARGMKGLPPTTSSGRSWRDLDKQELETIMGVEAAKAGELFATTRGKESLGGTELQRYRAERNEIRRAFVAAALEYTLQGHPIRETAFFKGYAPLILKKGAWLLR